MMRRRLLSINEEYIKSGLILWLDGVNRGNESGKWYNLVGNHVVTLEGTYTELSDGIDFPGTSPYGLGVFDSSTGLSIDKNIGTVEWCVELTALESTGRPVLSIASNKMGGSIATRFSSNYGPGMRFYVSGGSMDIWRFPISISDLKLTVSGSSVRGYCNGIAGSLGTVTAWSMGSRSLIASRDTGNPFKGIIHSIRLYDRILTRDEVLQNQREDNKRFNLGLTI